MGDRAKDFSARPADCEEASESVGGSRRVPNPSRDRKGVGFPRTMKIFGLRSTQARMPVLRLARGGARYGRTCPAEFGPRSPLGADTNNLKWFLELLFRNRPKLPDAIVE